MTIIEYNAASGLDLVGDELGAWMADNVAETLLGTQEISNGDFTSNDVTFWDTVDASVSITGNGVADVNYVGPTIALLSANGYLSSDTDYEIVIKLSAYTSGGLSFLTNPTTHLTGVSSTEEYFVYFKTPLLSDNNVQINTSGFVGSIDYIHVRKAIPDLSGKSNGLGMHESVIKSPVAIGSGLKSYANFSLSNFLMQPYNADMDFGVGDRCYMGWIMPETEDNQTILNKQTWDDSNSAGDMLQLRSEGTLLFQAKNSAGTASNAFTSSLITVGEYSMVAVVISNNSTVASWYINGVLDTQTTIILRDTSNNNASLVFGRRMGGSDFFTGSMVSWKIFGYAVTAARIKNIYDSEKILFHPNSVFTQIGEEYKIDVPMSTQTGSKETIRNLTKTISGLIHSVKQRDERTLELTTLPMHENAFDSIRRFLDSVDNGQTFVIDIEGTLSVPFFPQTAVMISDNYTVTRVGVDHLQVSFQGLLL